MKKSPRLINNFIGLSHVIPNYTLKASFQRATSGSQTSLKFYSSLCRWWSNNMKNNFEAFASWIPLDSQNLNRTLVQSSLFYFLTKLFVSLPILEKVCPLEGLLSRDAFSIVVGLQVCLIYDLNTQTFRPVRCRAKNIFLRKKQKNLLR